MKIIFNADDFGYCKGINLGIIEAYQNGVVRSATLMAGMPGFDHAALLWKQNQGLKIGVHLTLTMGKSVGGVYHTITDAEGSFLRLSEVEELANVGELDMAEVEAEYEAQIQKVYAAGISPSHFDSHHHTHNLPGITGVCLKLAKKYAVGVRRPFNDGLLTGEYAGIETTDAFSDAFFNEKVTLEDLKAIISTYGGGSLEIMCHPAYIDHTLFTTSSYNTKRAAELDVLTSRELAGFIQENGHQLCSFLEL